MQVHGAELSLSISEKDSRRYASVGGVDICLFSQTDQDMDRVALVMGDIARVMAPDGVTIFRDKSASGMNILEKGMKRSVGGKKFVVKPLDPDSKEINVKFDLEEATELDDLIERLKNFQNDVKGMVKMLTVSRKDALDVSSGHLVKSMWGAHKMQEIMDSIHDQIQKDAKWDKSEFYGNMILRSLDRFLHKMASGPYSVCPEDKKVMNMVLIPNVIQNFEIFRTIVLSALICLSRLVHIDEDFEAQTSYPADWFINGNMLADLKGDYDKMIRYILRLPEIESRVIYPLDFLKLQFLSENIK